MEDEVFEQFYIKKYQVQTIKNEEFTYIGLVNKFNKPEGMGRMVLANSTIYEGSFKNGQITGFGRKLEPNGSVFLGLYYQGMRQGQGTLITSKGEEMKGQWNSYCFDG